MAIRLLILLQRRDLRPTGREHGRAVAGPRRDDQRVLPCGWGRELDQAGHHHRLHQRPAASERDVIVDIGQGGESGGRKRSRGICRIALRMRGIRDLVGPDLAIHHADAGRFEVEGRGGGLEMSMTGSREGGCALIEGSAPSRQAELGRSLDRPGTSARYTARQVRSGGRVVMQRTANPLYRPKKTYRDS